MDHSNPGRPLTRRRVLGDGTQRANEISHAQQPEDVRGHEHKGSPTKVMPHNESIVQNGTFAIRHEQQSMTPENKRLSAVRAHETRPHSPKRDSAISNASTNASNTSRRRKTHIGP